MIKESSFRSILVPTSIWSEGGHDVRVSNLFKTSAVKTSIVLFIAGGSFLSLFSCLVPTARKVGAYAGSYTLYQTVIIDPCDFAVIKKQLFLKKVNFFFKIMF